MVAAVATDYYALLGVRPDASDEEIKRAYRRMARELHPDSTGGDADAEARFKEVSRAYEVLRDPERRARYDRYGPEQMGSVGADPFFGSGLGGLFDAFFGGAMGGAASRSGPVRGADAEVVLELELTEAVFGAHKDVAVDVPVACDTCAGSGARQGTSAIRCPDCDGTGEMRRVRQSILGQVVTTSPCRRCQGMGEIIGSPCPTCRGDGRRMESRTYQVAVPAGVDHGSTMRLSGRGAAGPRGGPPGDLYVHLSVREDERFARAGDDLHSRVHVSMIQAALGTSVGFSTLDGEEILSIPAGTQSGHVIRLRGRGVPHVRGRGRGDILVEIVVDTPTGLTKAHEEMLWRMAAERGEQVAQTEAGLKSRLRSAFG
ncbi:MAG TPA: molecular chaperone DnaJ [Acidimicrobiales bacterium]|nr:molecular chaperone DnaJ [Acidimicrobiales bacterium]